LSDALAHAQDVEQAALLQFGRRLGTDEATVGDHAQARDGEAPAQLVDHRNQGWVVGGAAISPSTSAARRR
jgi:hypothetical protein